MNIRLTLQILLIVIINFDNNFLAQCNINKSQQIPQPDLLQTSDYILSKDYFEAEKALQNAIKTKDKSTICRGVKNESLTIRLEVVQVMNKLKEKEFVPCLIEALDNNQQPYRGGTESRRMQQKLNIDIANLLEELTGLELSVLENLSKDGLSKDDIEKVLKLSKEWWEFHQNTL